MSDSTLEIISDGSNFGLTISTENGSKATHKLTTVELTELILNLTTARAVAQPEIPREAPTGQIAAIADPIWLTGEGTLVVEGSETASGVSLLLRHPGAGWLGFVFPTAEAKSLGSWLMTHSATRNV